MNPSCSIFKEVFIVRYLSLELKNRDLRFYDIGVFVTKKREAERGFKVTRMSKPTKHGTKFTTAPFKDAEDLAWFENEYRDEMARLFPDIVASATIKTHEWPEKEVEEIGVEVTLPADPKFMSITAVLK